MSMKRPEFADWVKRLESSDESAAADVVDAFYNRLVGLARKRLAGMPPQVADDEGAVVSALRSFFSGVQQGQFPSLHDETDLWRVLATITARKAVRQLRRHWKQGGEGDHIDHAHEIGELLSREPKPDDEVVMLEQCRHCLELLDDGMLRQIAWMRLEGADTREIAARANIHIRSVQRKLKLIEAIWIEAMA